MSAALAGLEWGLGSLPEVLRAGRFPLDDRDFSGRYCGATHALHIYAYTARMNHGGTLIDLRPGDCTISPAGGETRYHLDEPGYHGCVHFRPMAHTTALVQIPLHQHLGSRRQWAADAVMRIAALIAGAQDTVLPRAQASAAMLDLLLSLSGSQTRPQRRDRGGEAAEAAAAALNADLVRPPSMPALARRLRLSQTHLARAFRQRYGMTMTRYVISRRLEEAQHLLQSTDVPIARIAIRLGFSDIQHLNKLFRRVVGVSPSAFRQAQGR